jgi:hypothetical protein
MKEEDTNLFTYASKNTSGSFDDCWNELIKLLETPQNYCHLIDSKKVKPLINEHGQFIKVGPAALRVHLNKEQGKVWL